jgi:MSHA biogenesis protein MshI
MSLFARKSAGVGGWLAFAFAADRIDCAHLRRVAGERPQLLRVFSCARGSGSGGDGQALAALSKEQRVQAERCTALLAPGEYQFVQIEALNVPDAELRDAARWRLKDLLEYPVEAATVDVVAVPAAGSTSGRPALMFAVAAGNDEIGARMRAFAEAKLALAAIDVPEMAQRNVAALFEEPGRGLALLAFDAAGCLLTLSAGGELYATRRIDVSAKALADPSPERRAPMIERVALEIQRTLDNFDRQFGAIVLSRLLVAPAAPAAGLVDALRESLYLPVEVLDLAAVMDIGRVPELLDPARQGQLLALIGAALRDEPGPS